VDPAALTEANREAERVAGTATGAAEGAAVASPNILTSRVKLKSNKIKKELKEVHKNVGKRWRKNCLNKFDRHLKHLQ
jgi:hypothetical protein